MKKYILKRVGISIVTVFVLVSVVFFLADAGRTVQ